MAVPQGIKFEQQYSRAETHPGGAANQFLSTKTRSCDLAEHSPCSRRVFNTDFEDRLRTRPLIEHPHPQFSRHASRAMRRWLDQANKPVLGLDRHLGSDLQEFLTVTTRQIGYRPNGSFFPKQLVRKGRDITHVNSTTNNCATLADCAKGSRNQRTDGCKDYGRIQLFRRLFIGTTGPHRSEASGKFLAFAVPWLRKGVNSPFLVDRHLSEDVACRAKSIKSQVPCVLPSDSIRAVADQTGAQQWRSLRVPGACCQMKAEPRVSHGVFCKAAVDRITSEPGILTKVLLTFLAVTTIATGRRQPGHTHPVADTKVFNLLTDLEDTAHDFMTEYQG